MAPNLLHFLILTVAGWLQREQQTAIAYLRVENAVLREHVPDKRIRFNDRQRRKLARAGKVMSARARRQFATLVTPDTLLLWFRRLVAKKYTTPGQRRGQPPVREYLEQLVVRLAKENPTWGYTRIRQVMFTLGHQLGRTTIANILRRQGIEPSPRRGMDWATFLKVHWGAIAAGDFFTIEVATFHGIVRYSVLFVIDLETRMVKIAGIVHNPCGEWTKNVFRELTNPLDGFLRGTAHLILDRDPVFTKEVVDSLANSNVTVVKTPARSPKLNAYAERFVRSIRQECLRHVVPLGARHLRLLVSEYVAHYNGERPHQGLGGKLIAPTIAANGHGPIQCRVRLGGLLRSYHREAA